MKALWLENKKLRFRNDLPVPEPSPGEALVKIRAAGICGTDLELVKGYYPFTGIPGHEFIGVVMKAPDDPKFEGKRVVGDINISCGQCRECMAGRSPHCEHRSVLGIRNQNGAFAQFICLPIKNLFTVPSSIPDEAAVFVEPVAAAIRILEQVSIRPSNRVLVLGAGRLGQLEAQVLSSPDATSKWLPGTQGSAPL
jgi:threonine dehydrogenase-like Zn-dependent dehydrogenase